MQQVTLSGSALAGIAPHLIPPNLMATLPQRVCLGRVRPKARPPVPRLSAYLKPLAYTLPTLPVDWAQAAMAAIARMYKNDLLGCCVISDRFHSVGIWTGNESGVAVQGTDAEVEATYRIWNPGSQDNGCVITSVLDYCRDHGITVAGQNHRIDGYVSVDWTNWDEVLVALHLFGALPLGINLPEAWTQNAIWEVTNTQIVGGHDVPVCAMLDANGVNIASWGRLYRITKAAFTSRTWLEECYAVLSPDWYAKASMAPNLIDAAQLKEDMAKLGGGTIPDIGPPPVVCPAGQHWDTTLLKCVPDVVPPGICPAGQHWDAVLYKCVPDVTPPVVVGPTLDQAKATIDARFNYYAKQLPGWFRPILVKMDADMKMAFTALYGGHAQQMGGIDWRVLLEDFIKQLLVGG